MNFEKKGSTSLYVPQVQSLLLCFSIDISSRRLELGKKNVESDFVHLFYFVSVRIPDFFALMQTGTNAPPVIMIGIRSGACVSYVCARRIPGIQHQRLYGGIELRVQNCCDLKLPRPAAVAVAASSEW